MPVPEYTETELSKLMLYIQHMTTSYDLNKDDIDDTFRENVKKWFLDVMEIQLFVYFDIEVNWSCGYEGIKFPINLFGKLLEVT